MDIAEIKPIEQEVHILAPRTRRATGLVFIVNSVQCDGVQEVVRKHNDAMINRQPVDKDAHGVNILVAAIVGWRWEGEATFEGSKPEFNEENVRRVLNSKAGKHFIREQLSNAVSDTDRFFTN